MNQQQMITDLPTKYHYFVTGGTKSQSSVIYYPLSQSPVLNSYLHMMCSTLCQSINCGCILDIHSTATIRPVWKRKYLLTHTSF